MTVLPIHAGCQGSSPLCRAQTFVLARLTSFNCDAVLAFAERQLARWARGVLHRAWQGARFAAELRHADSMVAAGGR